MVCSILHCYLFVDCHKHVLTTYADGRSKLFAESQVGNREKTAVGTNSRITFTISSFKRSAISFNQCRHTSHYLQCHLSSAAIVCISKLPEPARNVPRMKISGITVKCLKQLKLATDELSNSVLGSTSKYFHSHGLAWRQGSSLECRIVKLHLQSLLSIGIIPWRNFIKRSKQ